jgi:hypothetical protein
MSKIKDGNSSNKKRTMQAQEEEQSPQAEMVLKVKYCYSNICCIASGVAKERAEG